MKLNSQIKILISVLLVFAVLTSGVIFLKSQFTEKKEMITDLILQKNRFLSRAIQSADFSKIPQILNEELSVPEWSRTMLIDKNGKILFQDSYSKSQHDEVLLKSKRLSQVLSSGSSEGLFTDASFADGEVFLGYNNVPGVGAILSVAPVSLIQKSMAFQALSVGIITILILTFGLLLFSAVLNRLTLGLEILSKEADNIGRGNLKTRINHKLGAQEIEILANAFNSMAKNIEDLILVKEKKSYIDAEIRTAEKVQKSFFPELHVDEPQYSIAGYSEQLHGCGGDWLYHFRRGDYLYLGVGDVTGHGLSSALLTGVSRAVFSVFEDDPKISPARMLENLHKVLFKVAQGSLTMTFFLAKIDMTTGECTYSNASHCSPLLLNKSSGDWESEFILGQAGPLLGSESHKSFSDNKCMIKKGDWLFVYTDGVPEMKIGSAEANPKSLGDRRMIKLLKESLNKKGAPLTQHIANRLKDMRTVHPVDDDFSWMMVEFK